MSIVISYDLVNYKKVMKGKDHWHCLITLELQPGTTPGLSTLEEYWHGSEQSNDKGC